MNTDEPNKPSKPKRSISFRLLLLLSIVGVTVVFWAISVGVMMLVAWKETNKTYDAGLRESAILLFRMAEQQENLKPRLKAHRKCNNQLQAERQYYQVIRNNQVIMHSRKGSRVPFITNFEGEKNHGFQNVMIAGHEWRVFVVKSKDSDIEIQVAQSIEQRGVLLKTMMLQIGNKALILLILFVVISTLVVYALLKPLNRIAKEVLAKNPNNLTVLPNVYRTTELKAIVSSVNQLLENLSKALTSERQFTANAAHELRTHLARLDMKVQLLQRKQPELKETLADIRTEIQQYTKIVANLLMLSRLDPMAENHEQQQQFSAVNIADVVQQSMQQLDIGAQAKGIAWELRVDDQKTTIKASAELLGIMVYNILDNAIKYCPQGSVVQIDIKDRQDDVLLIISDNGFGVSEEQLSHLQQRFYRVLGTHVTGSGLGLSIVSQIAKVLDAHMQITSGEGEKGLRYQFVFVKNTEI